MKTKYSIKNMKPGVEYDVPLWVLKQIPGYNDVVYKSYFDTNDYYYLSALNTKRRTFGCGRFGSGCGMTYKVCLRTNKWVKLDPNNIWILY